MIKLINWKFSDMRATEFAIGDHVFISKGQWTGLQFSICGLGLSKLERDFFGTGFLEVRNVVNIYLGRIIISFDKQGTMEHFRSVKIVKTQPLRVVIKQGFMSLCKQINNRYHDFLNKRQFKQIYEFQIDKYYDGVYRFRSDLLSAFQLAMNYEADLIWKGRYILSPLGLSYEENRDQIAKYLGKRFLTKSGGFNLRDYKHDYDYEIRGYQKVI